MLEHEMHEIYSDQLTAPRSSNAAIDPRIDIYGEVGQTRLLLNLSIRQDGSLQFCACHLSLIQLG